MTPNGHPEVSLVRSEKESGHETTKVSSQQHTTMPSTYMPGKHRGRKPIGRVKNFLKENFHGLVVGVTAK